MIQSQTLLFSTILQATQMHILSPYSPGASTLKYTMHAHMPVALPMAMPSTHPHCPSKHTHMPIHPSIHMHHKPTHLYPHACRSAWFMRAVLFLVLFCSSFFSTLVMNMVKKNVYILKWRSHKILAIFFDFFF